jgi:hypothetical protein
VKTFTDGRELSRALSNRAFRVIAEAMVTEQAGLVPHSPLQLTNREPAAALATSARFVPG